MKWSLRWLAGTKHFPESKTLSRIQNTSRILGRVLNSGKSFGFWEVFLDSGKSFGFWEVFLDSGTCLDSGKCFVPTNHGRSLFLIGGVELKGGSLEGSHR